MIYEGTAQWPALDCGLPHSLSITCQGDYLHLKEGEIESQRGLVSCLLINCGVMSVLLQSASSSAQETHFETNGMVQ